MNQDRAASLATTLRTVADELDRRVHARTPPEGGFSPLVTRVLEALLNMPDAEFLALVNRVINRYQAAVVALAPPGLAPYTFADDLKRRFSEES